VDLSFSVNCEAPKPECVIAPDRDFAPEADCVFEVNFSVNYGEFCF